MVNIAKIENIEQMMMVLTVLFFVLANPITFDLVDRLVPTKEEGMVSQIGVAIHSIVFFGISMLIINILKK